MSDPATSDKATSDTPTFATVEQVPGLTDAKQIARAALARAKAAARAKGLRPGTPSRRTVVPGSFSGAGPSDRDPTMVGDVVERLLRQRGWTQEVNVGGVFGRWAEVVGPDIAEHCTPVAYADGELTVQTDSTAWATQVRLLIPQLVGRLAKDLGEGVVTQVTVLGPKGPGFGRGRRTVPGRGPRDTWG